MRLPDLQREDTIAALATPPGTAALALLRISGPLAVDVCARAFGKPLQRRHARVRRMDAPGLDEFLYVVFLAPRSYTGEEMVEISCHGNPLVAGRLLDALFSAGARPAQAGEFTYRAVLNGKMTVPQAERLAHRLHARLPWELDLVEHGEGAQEAFARLLQQVQETLADLESDIEFGEGAGPHWENLAHEVRTIAAQARRQDRFSRLARVLLAGAVNTGKSTLFNRIAGYERALVSDAAGTTRDWLETEVRHAGIPFLLVDSAGLRDAAGGPEADGIRNTRELVRDADVIVAFSDDPAWENDERVIRVTPKADAVAPAPGTLAVSGRTGEGVLQLLDRIVEKVRSRQLAKRPEWWFSARFAELAREIEAMAAGIAGQLPEIQAEYLRAMARRIQEALDVPPADLYDLIFSRFCVGK